MRFAIAVAVASILLCPAQALHAEDPPTLITEWCPSFPSGLRGLAVDRNGIVYVTSGHTVQAFSGDGSLITQWGGSGTGPGQFNNAYHLAVDDSLYVYVVDCGNDRVQKFTSQGVYVGKWGGLGLEPGQMDTPWGITIGPSGLIYVSDHYPRIQAFTPEGSYVSSWETDGLIMGLAAAEDDVIYAAGYLDMILRKYSSDGTLLTSWDLQDPDPQITQATGVDVDEFGNIYVVRQDYPIIKSYTPEGILRTEWGLSPEGLYEFWVTYDIALAPDGTIYVQKSIQRCVSAYSAILTPVIPITWGQIKAKYR